MDDVLTVTGLCKQYPDFHLQNVSFHVSAGHIMGFIGRNGAGKTTTLKCLLNLVHPDAGKICFFGTDLVGHEDEIKQRIGYTAGGEGYYPHRRLRDITAVTRTFYPNWDDRAYTRCLSQFQLDETKKFLELSEGMKVKYHLAMALSHHAELLLLDEPTSGLDPVSREELLDIFMDLAAAGTAVLFSTHITSDLEKCADDITYIQGGKRIASQDCASFLNAYRLVRWESDVPWDTVPADVRACALGVCRSKAGNTVLLKSDEAARLSGQLPQNSVSVPDLQTIMVHLEKAKEEDQ